MILLTFFMVQSFWGYFETTNKLTLLSSPLNTFAMCSRACARALNPFLFTAPQGIMTTRRRAPLRTIKTT